MNPSQKAALVAGNPYPFYAGFGDLQLYFDYTDPRQLYQDNAFTVPVTAVGQNILSAYDKSKYKRTFGAPNSANEGTWNTYISGGRNAIVETIGGSILIAQSPNIAANYKFLSDGSGWTAFCQCYSSASFSSLIQSIFANYLGTFSGVGAALQITSGGSGPTAFKIHALVQNAKNTVCCQATTAVNVIAQNTACLLTARYYYLNPNTGNDMIIRVNGVQQANTASTAPPAASTSPANELCLYGNKNNGTQGFLGGVQRLLIYKGPLSDEAISSIEGRLATT